MLRRLADLARLILLAVSLLAGLTAWIFVARPDWVDAYDADLVAAHTGDAEAALARAQRSGASSLDVIAELRSLLASLDDARKGDRLAPTKRTAFALLARAQQTGGDAAAALTTAQAWQAFDALDLEAKLAAHDALTVLPGRRQEAAGLACELFALAPDRERFLLPHLTACLQARDDDGVAQAFFAHLAAGGTPASADLARGWTLLRDDGEGFDPARPDALEVRCDGTALQVSFLAPLGARRMQLHFPPRAVASLHDARFQVVAPGGTIEVPLRDVARMTGQPFGVSGLRVAGDALVLDGHDAPSLLWWLGPGAGLATTWTLCARVEQTLPAWLADALACTAVGQRGRALLASDAVEDARARPRYRACRLAVLRASSVSLQLGDEAATALPLAADGDEHVTFRAVLPRAGHAQLRLLLPSIAGADLHLRAPFAVETRLLPASTVRVVEGALRADTASAAVVLALQPGDPDTIELLGRLR